MGLAKDLGEVIAFALSDLQFAVRDPGQNLAYSLRLLVDLDAEDHGLRTTFLGNHCRSPGLLHLAENRRRIAREVRDGDYHVGFNHEAFAMHKFYHDAPREGRSDHSAAAMR